MRVTRFDAIRLDKIQRTPAGGLRIPAVVTRPGVFVYHDMAGQVIREYRPPDEVHHPESLASLRDAAVTIGHPPGMMVDPDNWSKLSVGHTAGALGKDADTNGVATEVTVARKDAIGKVAARELHDISMGYSVDIDETPGTTPEGERYDRVQRNIRYNHAALLPRGDGRQGTQVSLRLDSAANQISETSNMKITIRFDGKDHEVEAGSAEHISLQARVDGAKDAEIATLKARVDEFKKGKEEAEAKLTAAEAKLKEEDEKKKKDSRDNLEKSARGVLGAEAKFDGQTDRQVKETVIKRFDAAFDSAGKPDAYVDAYFDIASKGAATKAEASTARRDAVATELLAPKVVSEVKADADAANIPGPGEAGFNYTNYVQAQKRDLQRRVDRRL